MTGKKWFGPGAWGALALAAVMTGASAQQPRPSPPRPAQAPGGGDAGVAIPAPEFTEEELTQPFIIDFSDQSLQEVLQLLGPRIGRNFVVDQALLQTKVTFMSYDDPIPADKAREVLEAILARNNLQLVEAADGAMLSVINRGERPDLLNVYTGRQEAEGSDRMATHIIPVEYVDATEVTDILNRLSSGQGAQLSTYAPTNTLVITDTAEAVRKMLEVLEFVDQPGLETETEVFILEYTNAATLATQIQDVLLGPEEDGGGPGQAPRPPTRRIRPQAGQGEEPLVVGKRQEVLHIVPDERLNALIVTATETKLDQVYDLVEKLDTPTPWERSNWHVVEILNADAEKLAEALTETVQATTPRAQAQAQGGGGGGGGGGAASGGVSIFEKDVQIHHYQASNRLIVVASPQDFQMVEAIIAQLDVPPRQVHISAIILEVTINDQMSLKVETAGLTGEDAFGLNNVVALANILANGPLAAANETGFVGGIIDGTTEITVPDGAGGTATTTIPNIPLLLTALEQITSLDVLSQPSLITREDSEEDARILVGQNVPFIRGSVRDLGQTSTQSSVYSSVDREDVGIELNVMNPRITEGDYVAMDLTVEISNVVESAVGADPNIVGPTLSKSEVTAPVVIRDGSTGWIGGLIRERISKTRQQPPLIGDLPLVGWLFRQQETQREKQNLIILVTPHIVREGPDFERLTEYGKERFGATNEDIRALFESGFIEKVRHKYFQRTKHSPAMTGLGKSGSQSGFDRGEVRD